MAEGGDYDVDERTKLIDPIKPNDDDDDSYMFEMKERNQRIEEEKERRKKKPTHGGAQPKTHTNTQTYENPSYEVDEPSNLDKMTATVSEMDENQNEAWKRIKSKFPKFKFGKIKFNARVDEFDNVRVKLLRRGSREHNFFNDNDELNKDLPSTFTKDLGPPADKIIEKIDRNNERWKEKNREDGEQLKRQDISEEERKMITDRVNMRNGRIADGEQEIEILRDRMKLKDKIKSIFKEHGFTVVAVVTAVGAIIGVIISNLKTGLAKMAKGVGNGLKDIGKKLGALLPGMIGAIASFIFKTAGEVVGFLAKNAWLLIIAVVIAVVDRFKSGASTKTAEPRQSRKSFKKKNK